MTRDDDDHREAGDEPRRAPVFTGFDKDDGYEEPDPRDTWPQATLPLNQASDAAEIEEPWTDEDDYPEDELEQAEPWPIGLITVAVVALLLLAAGGYGVMQQRSATQEEIRQLQAALATAGSPEETAASRAAVQEVEQRNAELQASVDTLTLENRRLEDTVTGLESQLQAQQETIARQTAKTAASRPAAALPVTPKTAVPQPAAPKPSDPAASGNGTWFVNFASYSQRATAELWIPRLRPASGKVVVTSGIMEGEIFYRVRVVNLANRDVAHKIARQLEQEYGLSKLWVGRR